MKIRPISNEDAFEICARQEGHFFDRKALEIKGAGVQKIAVAFANADGGEFIIGVIDDDAERDANKRWRGAPKIEKYNSHLQVLAAIQPGLDFSFEFLSCEGKPGYLLRVQIEKDSFVHQTSDNIVYQRIGAQSLPITDQQKIFELTFAKGAASFEDQIINGVRIETIVESAEIKKFLSEYSPKTDPLDFIVNQHLIDQTSWEPKAAGILLFNDNPSACMPRKCAVKIARYETKEDEPERDHLKDQFPIEGPLYQLIHKSIEKVTEIMSSIKIWTTEGLRTVNYPPEAIWEIIVNAIIHRDYSISDDIQVYIYDNRIEVLSPGKLPGYVTTQNILDARYSRNPKIVRTLNRYKDAPNKDLGEGLNTAFQKMKDWKLKDPEIYEEKQYVKVIIPHTPLATPSELILKFLEKNDVITNKQARDITGIRSENLVKNEFYKLRDENLLERVPGLKGPASAWRLKPKRIAYK
jgi:ATP-dependent DNA helicase RecG